MINNNSFQEIQFLEKEKERALWKAVISQALVDMKTQSKKHDKKNKRIQAMMWFNLNNQDFLTVCDYAGVEPSYIYQQAQEIKKQADNNNQRSR